jgi:hypothetical protein
MLAPLARQQAALSRGSDGFSPRGSAHCREESGQHALNLDCAETQTRSDIPGRVAVRQKLERPPFHGRDPERGLRFGRRLSMH